MMRNNIKAHYIMLGLLNWQHLENALFLYQIMYVLAVSLVLEGLEDVGIVAKNEGRLIFHIL